MEIIRRVEKTRRQHGYHLTMKAQYLLLLLSLCGSIMTYNYFVHADVAPQWSGQVRKSLAIVNNSSSLSVPSGYTMTLDVTGLDASPSADLHVVYWNGSTNTEINRDVETDSNTGKVYARFELQVGIAPSATDNTSYWLYYGSSGNPGAPLANLSNVYQHYSNFTGSQWDSSLWGTQPGCATLGASGASFTSSNAVSCQVLATVAYGVGYADEFTQELTTDTGGNAGGVAYGFADTNAGSNSLRISNHYCPTSDNTGWGYYNSTSGTGFNSCPSISNSMNTFYVLTASRASSSSAQFSVDFGAVSSYSSNVPTGNLYPWINMATYASQTMTTVISQVRVRYAMNPEPTVSFNQMYIATSVYGQNGSYTSSGATISGGTASESGPAVVDSSGGVYIAEYGNNRILYFPSGSSTPARVYGQPDFQSGTANNGGISANSLNWPSGMALDSSGNLYVADEFNNRILEYPAGSTTATKVWGQGGSFTTNTANNGGITASSLNSPSSLYIDGSGNLYVADYSNNRVLYFAAGSTTATRVYGQGGSFTTNTANNGGISANSLNVPAGISLDSTGNVYITDTSNNRVLEYPSSGSTTANKVWGQSGSFTTGTANNGGISATSLSAPARTYVDSSGNLFISDVVNNRILYYASGSTTASRVYGQNNAYNTGTANNGGVSAGSLSAPYNMFLDSSGNLYVGDYSNNRELYFPSGQTTATKVWGQAGYFTTNAANFNAGSLTNIGGMAEDANGGLYVSDYGDSRVLYFAPGATIPTQVYGQPNLQSSTANNGGITSTSLNQSGGLALDSAGDLYVADYNNNRVLFYPRGSTTATAVYGQGGVFTTNTCNKGGSVTASTLCHSGGVAVDSSNNLYISDNGNDRILYFPNNGVGNPALTTATKVYGQAGSFTSGTSNNGGISANSLSSPVALSLDSSNNLYVADYANNRVLYYASGSTTATRVYGQGGSFTSNTANNGGVSAGSLSSPAGVNVDTAGNVYIGDRSNNRILYYPSGSNTATRVYGEPNMTTNTQSYGGVSSSSFNGPQLAYPDSQGNLYVGEWNGNRVLKFQLGLTPSTQPPSTIGAGMSFGVGFTAQDVGSGLTFTDYTGNISVAITTNPSGGTLSGTTTTAASSGVASFSGLSINNPGTGYVLSGSAAGYISAATSSFTVNPGTVTGPPPPPWSTQARTSITITNTSTDQALPLGYTITDDVTGLDISPGSDLHVVYWNGSTNTELDRDIETDANTGKVYARFELQASIPASGQDTTHYWLYYGTTGNPGSPKTTLANVYQHYTDFTTGSWSDSSFWGSQPGCVSLTASGAQFSTNGCALFSQSSYATGYAVEFTTTETSYSGTDAEDQTGFNGGGSLVLTYIQYYSSNNHISTVSNNSGTATYGSVSPTINPVTNQAYILTTSRPNSSLVNFSTDFTSTGNSSTNVPTNSEQIYIYDVNASGTMTFVISSFRLRLAIDSEPAAINGTTFPASWSTQSRTNITIANTSTDQALPIGYTITDDVTGLDANGAADMHVIYWNDSTNTELDRDLETDPQTGKVYARFELQSTIPASNNDTMHYWLYYGSAGNPGVPKATLANVYQHYTDFTSGSWGDAAFWGSQPGCSTLQTGANGGIALVSTGSGCALIAAKNSATGYAAEFTTEELNTTGYGEMEFYNNTGPEYVRIQYSCSGQVWKLDAQTSNSNATTTCPNPSVSIPTGTFNVYTISRPVNTIAYYSFDFGNQYSITTNLPTNNMYPAAEATNNTETVSQFRLRLAIDSEPAVSNGVLETAVWAVDTTQTGSTARYGYTFITATSGSISSITMTVPSGTTGSPAIQEHWGLGAGTISLASNTLTYTVTSPVSIPANTPIRLIISGLTNTSTSGSNTSTITTYNGSSAIDQGTTNNIVFTTGSNTSTGLQADAESSTVSSVLTSANLVLDPLTNNTATYTYNVTMTTDACTSWSMAFKDGGLKMGGYTINPVSSNGVANAGTWPTGSDKNVVGYQISGVTPTNGSATYQGTLSSSTYAGFKTSTDTFLSGTPNSGATETITFTVTVKVQVSFATKAGLYSDTPQLIFTPAYC